MGLEIGAGAEREATRALIGEFEDEGSAGAAMSSLIALGIGPEAVTLTRVIAEAPPPQELPVEPVKGGAATGAVLGGVVGLLLGWMVGVEALALPGVGVVEDAGALPAMLAGLGLGAVGGGLVGALTGLTIPRRALPSAASPRSSDDGPVYMTVEAPILLTDAAEAALIANGALGVQGAVSEYRVPSAEYRAPSDEEQPLGTSYSVSGAHNEETDMIEKSSDAGRDPNSITGATDAIDPETGTLGTGGTPMTTGYGVSGSTAGTGTEAGRMESEEGEPRRPTPDAASYERGGRASEDRPEELAGTEHGEAVEEKYGPMQGEDTSGSDKPGGADRYTQSPSYGGGGEEGSVPDAADTGISRAEQYSSAAPDEPPSYANVESSQTQESAGTNIPGTEDPRGLGDNTDR